MKGFNVSFNIYAESQEQADMVSKVLGDFVNDYAANGIAVSAPKILALPELLKSNSFIDNKIKRYFSI